MGFKIGDVVIDRTQFVYGATKAGVSLYALTQVSNFTIDITADSTDITDARGNLVYRKYTGKKGEVTATNAFMNLAIISAIAANDAEIASGSNKIKMPVITTVKAGETLDITGYVKDSVVVSGLSNGAIGKTYTLAGSDGSATATEFGISSNILTPPKATDETEYFVKYVKEVDNGEKITVTSNDYPKSQELFVKALAVDPCDDESFRACIIHIPSFMPSPEVSLALEGGESQSMDFKGSILMDMCSTEKIMFEVYFIDEPEENQ